MANVRIDQYPSKPIPVDNDYLLIQDSQDLDVNGIRKYKKTNIGNLPEIINNVPSYTYAELLALATASGLIAGRSYLITNATSGSFGLMVEAVSVNVLADIATRQSNGDSYRYTLSTNVGILIPTTIALGTSNQVLGINNAGSAQEYKTVSGTANQVDVTQSVGGITLSLPQDIATNSNVQFNNITAAAIIKSGGTSSQFLKADGSIDSSTYLTSISGTTNKIAKFGSSSTVVDSSISDSGSQIITFGATNTGETHIFGGSARVNGQFTVSYTGALPTTIAKFTNGSGSQNIYQDGGGGGLFTNALSGWYTTDSNIYSLFSGGTVGLRLQSSGAATFSAGVTVTNSIAIGNAVTAAVAVASTHKVTMVIGGVTYYLLATT